MQEFRAQAERFGAEYLTDDVTRVDFSERPFRVYVGDEEYLAETVIVATGATARQLGLPSERGAPGQGRHVLRSLRRGVLPRPRGDRGRRRRLRDGGGALPDEVRDQGDDRAPPRRVPRLADHARPRPRARQDRVRHERGRRRGARRREDDRRSPPRHADRRDVGSCRPTGSSSRSVTTRTRSSSSTSSSTTTPAT